MPLVHCPVCGGGLLQTDEDFPEEYMVIAVDGVLVAVVDESNLVRSRVLAGRDETLRLQCCSRREGGEWCSSAFTVFAEDGRIDEEDILRGDDE